MSHSLNSVRIKGFKSILDTTLDLGKVNILIGENGAGKSNILEAIGMLSAATSGEIDYARLQDRGVRLSAPEVFKSAFKGQPRAKEIVLEIQFNTNRYLYRVSLIPKRENSIDLINYKTELFQSRINGKKKDIASKGPRGGCIAGVKLAGSSYEYYKNRSVLSSDRLLDQTSETSALEAIDSLRQFSIYAPSTPILRGISPDESKKAPLGLYGGSLAQALSEVFKNKQHKILEIMDLLPWAGTFGYGTPGEKILSQHVHIGAKAVAFKDRRMLDNFNRLLSYDVSEGALYVLFFYVLMLHKSTPPIIAIDNIDSALNPRMSEQLLKRLVGLAKKEDGKQLLITTHNPQALNSIDLFDDDVRLFVVERDTKTGGTSARRINPIPNMTREKWNEVMEGRTLAELWMSGALGALPNI